MDRNKEKKQKDMNVVLRNGTPNVQIYDVESLGPIQANIRLSSSEKSGDVYKDTIHLRENGIVVRGDYAQRMLESIGEDIASLFSTGGHLQEGMEKAHRLTKMVDEIVITFKKSD
jgi:hypothetical protein